MTSSASADIHNLPEEVLDIIIEEVIQAEVLLRTHHHCPKCGPTKPCDLLDKTDYANAMGCAACGCAVTHVAKKSHGLSTCCDSLLKAQRKAVVLLKLKHEYEQPDRDVVKELRQHLPHLQPTPVPPVTLVSKQFRKIARPHYLKNATFSFKLGDPTLKQVRQFLNGMIANDKPLIKSIRWHGEATHSNIKEYLLLKAYTMKHFRLLSKLHISFSFTENLTDGSIPLAIPHAMVVNLKNVGDGLRGKGFIEAEKAASSFRLQSQQHGWSPSCQCHECLRSVFEPHALPPDYLGA